MSSPRSRRALLGAVASLATVSAGCVGDESTPTSAPVTSSPTPGSDSDTAATATATPELPPVRTPSAAALERWCDPAANAASAELTVLDERLGANEHVVRVGFAETRDGDAPVVDVVGVLAGTHVGEHAHLAGVELVDGVLSLDVEEGYETETGTLTEYGMSIGVAYRVAVRLDGGFPDAVAVSHHGRSVRRVEGPC